MKNWCRMESPIGDLILVSESDRLLEIRFTSGSRPIRSPDDARKNPEAFHDARRQLEEYFAGDRKAFDLPLAPRGTEFQQRVWQALLEIPFGRTCAYSDIASRLGNPKAVRAVGMANGRNPIPIIIPCHRVIGRNGSLTGYAGGLDIKTRLLELEGAGVGEPRGLFD